MSAGPTRKEPEDAEFSALDALFPLDSLVNASDSIDPEDYFEGAWNTNYVNDTLYGVP